MRRGQADRAALPGRGLLRSSLTSSPPPPPSYIENEFFGDMGRYFGVFDGHAGTNCVEYVVRCLANNILGGFSYTPAAEDPEAQKNVRGNVILAVTATGPRRRTACRVHPPPTVCPSATELAAQLQEPITNLAEVEKMLKDAPDNADLIGMRDMLQVGARGCAKRERQRAVPALERA